MFPRFLRLAILGIFFLFGAVPAVGQEQRVVEVVEIKGIIDDRTVDFVIANIESAAKAGNVEVMILQIDSPAVVSSPQEYAVLLDLVASPPLPLVAWAGDAPGSVSGGVLELIRMAPLRAAAPGITAGYWNDGSDFVDGSPPVAPAEILAAGMTEDLVVVDRPVAGVFDLVQAETASPRQLAQLLDGRSVAGTVLSTVRPFTGEDDQVGVTVLPTILREKGFWAQTLGLASQPEAMFFFLVTGLTIAAFEFYAIGPGIAAGVAAACLGLAGAGMSILPVRLSSVGLIAGSVWLLSFSYQRGGVVALSGLGLVGLTIGGFWITNGSPLISPGPAGILLTLAAAAFFFLLAMPVVARSRFSTRTIGREDLIGRMGRAVVDLAPDGEVDVAGGRWKATSHREAGIKEGDDVVVTAVDGWYLEVDSQIAKNRS